MNLEEAIKQDKFKSEYQKLIINLVFTSHWIESKNHDLLKPFGISSQQYNIMRILRGQNPKATTIKDLQSRMLDKMSNASRLVDKLKQKGLVDRVQSKDDRRTVQVSITPKGLDILKKIDPIMDDREKNLHKITEKDAKVLNELLDKVRY